MGFFKKLFQPKLQYVSAQTCIDLVRSLREELGQNSWTTMSPDKATDEELLGSLMGIVDYLAAPRNEPTGQAMVLVLKELFGENGRTAFDLIRSGADRPRVLNATFAIQEKLTNAESREEKEKVLKSVSRLL